MSRYLLLTTEKDVNTQDWYREHERQHQIVVIWQTVFLQSATRAPRSVHQSQLALLCGSTVPLLLRALRHPFSTFPPPPGHGMLLPQFHHWSTEVLTDLCELHQPHHLPPHRKGMKCMAMKEGFSQISSLSYLPLKTPLGQPKMQLYDSSSLSVSLLPCCHSFLFHQLCILTLFLVLALVFAWPASSSGS